jgi:cobalt-zinc-cadmium efflux system membrane fusion protein
MNRGSLMIPVIAAMYLAGCGDKLPTDVAASTTQSPTPQAAGAGEVVIPQDSPKLKQIRVDTAEMAQVPADDVASPGKVEANPNRLSHVLLPVSGRVSKVFVRIGDAVKQGQPLLSLESPDVDVAISTWLQASAAVTQSSAALAKAEADLDRSRDLFDNNAVAKKEVLNAEAVRTQTKAALDQAQASQQQSLRRLEILGVKPGEFGQTVEVRAPISGKVLEMNVVPGEYRNDTSTPVLSIADLSTVWVTADVPESSIRLVDKGQPVEIGLDAYPGETFRGRVAQIADIVDPQTRTIKVRAELDNPGGRLRPEMFARIRLADRFEAKPVVPASAVVHGESGSYVMREVAPGRFRRTRITTGNRLGESIAVLSGLTSGDRIVTYGVMLVRN